MSRAQFPFRVSVSVVILASAGVSLSCAKPTTAVTQTQQTSPSQAQAGGSPNPCANPGGIRSLMRSTADMMQTTATGFAPEEIATPFFASTAFTDETSKFYIYMKIQSTELIETRTAAGSTFRPSDRAAQTGPGGEVECYAEIVVRSLEDKFSHSMLRNPSVPTCWDRPNMLVAPQDVQGVQRPVFHQAQNVKCRKVGDVYEAFLRHDGKDVVLGRSIPKAEQAALGLSTRSDCRINEGHHVIKDIQNVCILAMDATQRAAATAAERAREEQVRTQRMSTAGMYFPGSKHRFYVYGLKADAGAPLRPVAAAPTQR